MKSLRAVIVGLIVLILAMPARAAFELYDVDPRYRQEVYHALAEIYMTRRNRDQESAIVQLLPSGQILVDASDEMQAQVAAVLAEIARRDPGPTPSVMLRYWVLLGARGQAAEPPPPILEGVLRQLQAVHGDLPFTVLDAAALLSQAGHRAVVESARGLAIGQTVYPDQGRVDAEIRIARRGLSGDLRQPRNSDDRPDDAFQTLIDVQELEVRVALEPGEFLVLGESTVETGNGTGVSVFVVHWPSPD